MYFSVSSKIIFSSSNFLYPVKPTFLEKQSSMQVVISKAKVGAQILYGENNGVQEIFEF